MTSGEVGPGHLAPRRTLPHRVLKKYQKLLPSGCHGAGTLIAFPRVPTEAPPSVLWAISAKVRNRLVHAQNGNPAHPRVPPGDGPPQGVRRCGAGMSRGG